MKKLVSAFLLAAITLGFVAQAKAICPLMMQGKIEINANTNPAPAPVEKGKPATPAPDQGVSS